MVFFLIFFIKVWPLYVLTWINPSSQLTRLKFLTQLTHLELRMIQDPWNVFVNAFRAVFPKFVHSVLQIG